MTALHPSRTKSVQFSWSAPVSDAEAHRRAGGRRRYNLRRQIDADRRRQQIASWLAEHGWHRGIGRTLAAAFGVSETTITRDLQQLRWLIRADDTEDDLCPVCRRPRFSPFVARVRPAWEEEALAAMVRQAAEVSGAIDELIDHNRKTFREEIDR